MGCLTHFDRVYFDGLRERQRQDELLVAVGLDVAAAVDERRQRMIVGVVEGLALVLHDERGEVHLAGHAAVLAGRRARRVVQLLDFRLDRPDVGALDPRHLNLVAVQHERRHGRHTLAGRRLLALVHVHLEKHRAVVLVGQLVEQRRNAPARAAPGSREVYHHEFGAVGVQLLQKLRVVHHLLDDHLVGWWVVDLLASNY